MTAETFGDAPELSTGQVDPLSPDHVVTLVRFLPPGERSGVRRLPDRRRTGRRAGARAATTPQASVDAGRFRLPRS